MQKKREMDRWRTVALCLLPLWLTACGSAPKLQTTNSAPVVNASASQNNSTLPKLPPAGSGRGGYYQDDGPGDNPPEGLRDIPDAIPKVEPYASGANKPYVVFGKTYTPFTDNRRLKQHGVGSWYGKKFHGQRTSSGELYDMYKMTAAHPTMPIPSYARVTNLKNGAQVIVRVNDRGPFHSNRIIDLSYAAALKLGYLSSGSSELEVERLLPADIEKMAQERKNPSQENAQVSLSAVVLPTTEQQALPPAPELMAMSASPTVTSSAASNGFYLQFGAFKESANAQAARDSLKAKWVGDLPPLEVTEAASFYRLYSGPFANRADADSAARQAEEAGLPKPMVVQR